MNPNFIPTYSHRSTEFKNLFSRVTQKLLTLAGMDPVHDCALLISGSGTLANEVVLSSLKSSPRIATRGGFSTRLQNICEVHHPSVGAPGALMAGVQYETGVSQLSTLGLEFADCISAFPYYDIPKSARIATTVSSKQLLASCGLSIIFIRDYKTISEIMKPAVPSYLSLMQYVAMYERQQTPNTPAISAIEDLDTVLSSFNAGRAREQIRATREQLVEICGRKGIPTIGTGPVLTIDLDHNPLPDIDFYMNSGRPQCFLWSMTPELTERVVQALEAL